MGIRNIFLAMALLCFAGLWNGPARAQEMLAENTHPFAAEEALFWGEEEKIISATKYIKRLREAPAIASVISAEQIRNMGARNLMDILKTVPGIGVSINFANGHRGIESRGTRSSINSEKVLIMVDGHRLNNLVIGEAAWVFNDMMVENIKRVEVIRGPGSALYGANAFVAVINVITKGVEDIDGVDLLAGGGSFGTQHYDALFGKDFSGLKITGTLDYLDTNGPKPYVGSDLLGQSGKAKDWEEKYDLGLKASYEDFSFNGRFVNKDVGPYIGVAHALNDESEVKLQQFFGELSYSHDIKQDLHLLAKAYYDEFHYFSYWELFNEGAIPGYPDGMFGIPESKNRALGAEVQVDYSLWDSALWKANNVTAGILYEYDQQYDARHSTNFNPNTGAPLGSIQDITSWGNWQKNADRRITALYIQDVWKFTSELEGTFGVRFDHFSDFGSTVNPRAGLIWNFYEEANMKLVV